MQQLVPIDLLNLHWIQEETSKNPNAVVTGF